MPLGFNIIEHELDILLKNRACSKVLQNKKLSLILYPTIRLYIYFF